MEGCVCVCVRPFYRGWSVRLSVCVYEKVRDKLGEICAKVVMTFVCVYGAICTHDLSQETKQLHSGMLLVVVL